MTNQDAALISATEHHRRLCEAFDRGENVDVALKLAHEQLARLKSPAPFRADRKASK